MRERIKKAFRWLLRHWPWVLAGGFGTALVISIGLVSWLLLIVWPVSIATFFVGINVFFVLRDLSPRGTTFETEPAPMDIVDLGRAEDYIDTHYDVAAIDYFIKLLTQLPDHLLRVDEDVHMIGRAAKSTTHLVFRGVVTPEEELDEAASSQSAPQPQGTLLAPIAWVRKGKLFTDFRSFNHSGNLIPTLTQWQVSGLIVVTLRMLFERAIKDGFTEAEKDNVPKLPIDDRLVLLRLVRTATHPDTARRRSVHIAKLGRLVDGLDGKYSAAGKKVIRDFCESLIDIYVIVAEVERPKGDNVMVGYSNTIVPELSGGDTKKRAKHGLLPTKLDVPNPLVFQAHSYHFEAFPGNGDMYVYDQRIEQLDSGRPADVDKVTGHRWLIKKGQHEGSPAAHLYVRRQGTGVVPGQSQQLNGSKSTAADVKSVVEFREVPPGCLGNAVSVAFVTAAIVTLFALFGTRAGSAGAAGNSNANQYIPALLLTLPAFLAAVVGRGLTAERVLSTSLTAFRGLWVVAGISLTAVLVYIYGASIGLPLDIAIPAVFPADHRINLIWLFLALFSIGTLLYLRRRKNEERRHYLRVRTGN